MPTGEWYFLGGQSFVCVPGCFLSDKTCDGVMTLFEEKAKYDNT